MVGKVHCFAYENVRYRFFYRAFVCVRVSVASRTDQSRSGVFEALPGSFLLCLLLKGGGGEWRDRERKNAQMHSPNQPSLNSARIPTPEPPIID